jgi:hypothetical protein
MQQAQRASLLLAVAFLYCCSTLQMEAIRSSETSANLHPRTRRHIQEDRTRKLEMVEIPLTLRLLLSSVIDTKVSEEPTASMFTVKTQAASSYKTLIHLHGTSSEKIVILIFTTEKTSNLFPVKVS